MDQNNARTPYNTAVVRVRVYYGKAKECPIHQSQETFLRVGEISTSKLQFRHKNMETQRDI
jgi:hypothetical protein